MCGRAAGAFVRAASRFSSLATGIVETAGVDAKAGAQAVVEGATLGSYSFTRYKSEAPKAGVSSVAIMASEAAAKATHAGIDRGSAIADAVAMARDLVNTPGGSLNARDMAELATEVAKDNGLTIEVMDEHAMEQAGLGGMLGVNRGSDEPPRLIKLTYTPRNPTGSVALVGKGIMFDSGGLSLKSGEGMMSMKIDMSGAAAVLATMSALKATKPRVKVIGFLCCTDNMPSGTAFKPGDVITIRNGKTVEVLNTDAEGRLVLADGLSLAVEEDVDAIIDLATLTGAVVARARQPHRRRDGQRRRADGSGSRRCEPRRRAGVAAAACRPSTASSSTRPSPTSRTSAARRCWVPGAAEAVRSPPVCS